MNLQAATVPLTIANWGDAGRHRTLGAGLWWPAGPGLQRDDRAGRRVGLPRRRCARGRSATASTRCSTARRCGSPTPTSPTWRSCTRKTDPAAGHRGVTAFVVPTHTPGFEATRVPCRGLGKLMPTNAVIARRRPGAGGERARGGGPGLRRRDERDGLRPALVAARSVGLAQACLDAALEYADQREAFGEKIGSFQMVKKQLADMTCEVAAARALVRAAAASVRHRRPRDAGELDREVLRRRGVQPRGAGDRGHLRRRGVQRRPADRLYLNYAKLWQTGEGSANIQALLIADDALGWKRMDRHRTVLRPRTTVG